MDLKNKMDLSIKACSVNKAVDGLAPKQWLQPDNSLLTIAKQNSQFVTQM